MSKRKAGVNDIIYELDNDDVESSEDEGKTAKTTRVETEEAVEITGKDIISVDSSVEELSLDCSLDVELQSEEKNGGKTSEVMIIEDESSPEKASAPAETSTSPAEGDETVVIHEDIAIDSPHSDLGVVGCENRTPLVTVQFKDKKLAKLYKNQVKVFMLQLIKVHEDDLSGSDTDLELDVWPEDLEVTNDVAFKGADQNIQEEEVDNLFFVDTAPGVGFEEVPRYRQNASMIANKPEREPTPPPMRRGPTCFNCDGAHNLRDCKIPRNNYKISQNRQAMNSHRVGRYHVEDEQKYGHLVPGRISGQLRHALGLKRHELPLHIYRMRALGYPPGWLEEARISHSGITMFDSTGAAIQDPEEEEGEVCEPGSKDKFDIKKILDFPGFNVPASSRYKDEAHKYGMPPISEQDSKLAMLKSLAPNAMKAYKRKKLAFFPSASNNAVLEGQAEMEIDSGDEQVEFPSVPPLPDEAPPPPPPPPSSSPPPEPPAPGADGSTDEDLQVVAVMQVPDIPMPDDAWITIDEDTEESQGESQDSGERDSPSLEDLENKKTILLGALNDSSQLSNSQVGITPMVVKSGDLCDFNLTIGDIGVAENVKPAKIVQDKEKHARKADEASGNNLSEVETSKKEDNDEIVIISDSNNLKCEEMQDGSQCTDSRSGQKISDGDNENSTTNAVEIDSKPGSSKTENLTQITPQRSNNPCQNPKTPAQTIGQVTSTVFGTPVMNIASSFTKLPSGDKFAKDICDIINFENLPNSTGKYKQISKLLKKVKIKVDQIQDS